MHDHIYYSRLQSFHFYDYSSYIFFPSHADFAMATVTIPVGTAIMA